MKRPHHSARWVRTAVCIGVAVLCAAWVLPVGAAPAPAAPPQGIDVVVLIDDSGSVATCWPWSTMPPKTENCPASGQNPPSDPRNLRYSAVRLLTQLANAEDGLAVVRFNALTEGVIGQLQRAGGAAGRQALVDALRPPTDYVANGGYTRMDLALAEAQKILAARKDPSRPSYVLLLTDGIPSQPEGVPGQGDPVRKTMKALTDMGTQVLPVVLCNEGGGCPDDTFIKYNIGRAPEKAKTAGDLLEVFSGLFAQMEPGLHVVDAEAGGAIELNIRPEHGARRMVVVADKGGLQAVKRDDTPQPVTSAYQDDNVLINTIEGSSLAGAKSAGGAPAHWTVETQGRGGFVVVQTDTYPELAFPPPAVPGSAVAPYYVPAGKPVAILAQVQGPGAASPVRLADGSTLKPFAPGSKLLWTVLPGADADFRLQVGDDQAPLQIVRGFRLEARSDLPMALAQSPSAAAPCAANAACELKVALGPGADVSEMQAVVYITDQSDGGKLVYTNPMVCAGRVCSDPAPDFKRADGHRYTVRFFVQARSGGVRFGDWAETTLAVGPAVGLRGLPAALNLKDQPANGWPVTVTVGTTEDLGQLRASLALTRTEDQTPVPDVQVELSVGLAAAGEQATALRVRTPPDLRPGHYEGQITFATDKTPAGEPVILPAPLPVTLALARPAAEVLDRALDFGTVPFDTSPNFRLNQPAVVNVKFAGAPFGIVPAVSESSCPGLAAMAGEPVAEGDHYRVPLTLRSNAPVRPQTCTGTLALAGPSEDYEVQGSRSLAWRVAVPAAEWQLVGIQRAGGGAAGGDLAFGSLGRPGERSRATLLVRYTGQPPFTLALDDLQGQAAAGDLVPPGVEPQVRVARQDVELVTGEITRQPDTPDVYRVPVELVVSRPVAQAGALATWLAGTDYSGQLRLDIAGLPRPAPRDISFRFHNPSVYQRYIAPVYAWWWPGLITCPLSILLPLALLGFVWLRKKDADVERLLAEERAAGQEEQVGAAPGSSAAPRPAAAPAPAAGSAAAYMLYGRPTAKSYQVPPRPGRSGGQPAPGSGTAPGAARPAAKNPPAGQPPPNLPSRPPRRTR